jgi:hypothetical protein
LQEDVSRRRAERTIGYFFLGKRRIREAQDVKERLKRDFIARMLKDEMDAQERVARFIQSR